MGARSQLFSNHTASHLTASTRMGKFDGVYRQQTFDGKYGEILRAMDFPEVDIAQLTHPRNITTWTLFKNEDGSFTQVKEFSMAPHLNFIMSAKNGECVTMEKPVPCTKTMMKKSNEEFVQRMEIGGKVFLNKFLLHNSGFTKITSIEGGSLTCKEVFLRLAPDINGSYQLEREENMLGIFQQLFSNFDLEQLNQMKERGIRMRVEEEEDLVTIWWKFFEKEEKIVFKLDEPLHYHDKERGLKETRLLTKIAAGQFKLICLGKENGKAAEQSLYFTELGVSIITCVNGVNAKWFYKRCPDVDGLWKVVAKEGECGFLDACGEPEPMKSEIMAGRDSYEMKRLDYGKVLLQTNSKFLPAELTMAVDEHWDAELPDLGKVLGIMTVMKRRLVIVLKLNKKTITIRLSFNGDFLIQECDVDGEESSKMKAIMVRQ